jgi:hypothetical protein
MALLKLVTAMARRFRTGTALIWRFIGPCLLPVSRIVGRLFQEVCFKYGIGRGAMLNNQQTIGVHSQSQLFQL